jgi:hypothetical protein
MVLFIWLRQWILPQFYCMKTHHCHNRMKKDIDCCVCAIETTSFIATFCPHNSLLFMFSLSLLSCQVGTSSGMVIHVPWSMRSARDPKPLHQNWQRKDQLDKNPQNILAQT